VCEYCLSEGCACGSSANPCQAEVIGTKTCSACGCESSPWWSEIKISGSTAITDMVWDLQGNENFFPASKAQILRVFSGSEEDLQFLDASLPEQTYKDTGDIVAALISKATPMAWEKQASEILWKYPANAISPGQQLVVRKDQVAVLESKKTGRACEEFVEGNYILTVSNCPLLAQESRKVLPGYKYSVLNGYPVFVSPPFEFEIDLTTMGQTKALRKAAVRGVARVRVSTPKKFVQQFGKYNSEMALDLVTKYCTGMLQKEMSAHELDELSQNRAVLEKPLADGLRNAGLDPIKINFAYVGELGPGMFMPMPGQMKNSNNDSMSAAEQVRQMGEIMRSAQIARLQAIQQMMEQQRAGMRPSAPAPFPQPASPIEMITCPNCNAQNPLTGKFCNNCGQPLEASKNICTSCGAEWEPDTKFCGDCGAKL
jgi:membrane protease subunit (stomatin/prohibitin family)